MGIEELYTTDVELFSGGRRLLQINGDHESAIIDVYHFDENDPDASRSSY